MGSIVEGQDVVATDVPDGWVIDATEVTDDNLSQRFQNPDLGADSGVIVGFGNVDQMSPAGEPRDMNGVEWYVEINQVLDELERSGLRGRGGAGFSTATKWRSIVAGGEAARPRRKCACSERNPVVVFN